MRGSDVLPLNGLKNVRAVVIKSFPNVWRDFRVEGS